MIGAADPSGDLLGRLVGQPSLENRWIVVMVEDAKFDDRTTNYLASRRGVAKAGVAYLHVVSPSSAEIQRGRYFAAWSRRISRIPVLKDGRELKAFADSLSCAGNPHNPGNGQVCRRQGATVVLPWSPVASSAGLILRKETLRDSGARPR